MINRRRLVPARRRGALAWPLRPVLRAGGSPARAKRLIVFISPTGSRAIADGRAERVDDVGLARAARGVPEPVRVLQRPVDGAVPIAGATGRREEAAHRGGLRQRGVDRPAPRAGDRLGRSVSTALSRRAGDANNASGDMHISYVAPDSRRSEDDPAAAFARVFGRPVRPAGSARGPTRGLDPRQLARRARGARGKLGDTEKAKPALHLEAVREVETRIRCSVAAARAARSRAWTRAGSTRPRCNAPRCFPKICARRWI